MATISEDELDLANISASLERMRGSSRAVEQLRIHSAQKDQYISRLQQEIEILTEEVEKQKDQLRGMDELLVSILVKYMKFFVRVFFSTNKTISVQMRC